jgi:hypothetical protein
LLQYSYEDEAIGNSSIESNSTLGEIPNRTIPGLQITPMRQVSNNFVVVDSVILN